MEESTEGVTAYAPFEITKKAIRCLIQTSTNLIEGEIHVRGHMRIIDELKFDELFIPVTNAVVYGVWGEKGLRTAFVAVRRDDISWVVPKDEYETPDQGEE